MILGPTCQPLYHFLPRYPAPPLPQALFFLRQWWPRAATVGWRSLCAGQWSSCLTTTGQQWPGAATTGRRWPCAATTGWRRPRYSSSDSSDGGHRCVPCGERGGNRRGSHRWLADFGWPRLASWTWPFE